MNASIVCILAAITCGQAKPATQPAAAAEKLEPIVLNAPQLDKGIPVMQALKKRQSDRGFSDKKLSLQQLSEVLWAADGLNRDTGYRTAPSAMHQYPVDIYVVLQEGVYVYDPGKHQLLPVAAGDFRSQAGSQDFVRVAPLNLVYVANLGKLKGRSPDEEKVRWAAIEAGCMVQNVYLYCASEEIGAVIRGSIDRDKFAATVKLRPEQRVIAAQTVGFRK